MTQCILVALQVEFYALGLLYCNCKNECMSRYGLKWKLEGVSTHLELLRLISCTDNWLQESAECSPVQISFNTTFTSQSNNWLTIELIPYWKSKRFSASANIPLIFWYPYVQYRVHNSPSFAPWIQIKTFTSYFFSIHFNIIFQSTPMFSKRCLSLDFPTKNPHPFDVLPNVPSHPPYFIQRSNIWWWVQIMTTPRFQRHLCGKIVEYQHNEIWIALVRDENNPKYRHRKLIFWRTNLSYELES